MTMENIPLMAHLTREQYEAIRAREAATYAALAAAWGVEAVGRGYPSHHTRSNGYRYMRPGRWYVIRDGERLPASAAQARALNRVGSHGVGQIGPVAAA